MSTSEDRLANLERKVAFLELRRLDEEGKTQANMPSELGRTLREMNENMTILLGIIGKQGEILRESREYTQARFSRVEEQLTDIQQDNAEFHIKFDQLEKQQLPAIRQDMKLLQEQVTGVKQDVAGLHGEIAEVRADLHGEIIGVRVDLHEEIAEVRVDLHEEIVGVRVDLHEEIVGVKQDVTNLHGKFDHLESRFDGLEKLIIDRLPPS